MAQDENPAAQKELTKFQYVQGRDYRRVAADHAVVVAAADRLGTTFQVFFSQLEAVPNLEEMQTRVTPEGAIEQTGPSQVSVNIRRVNEICVLLRPDHAFLVAELIFSKLAELPEPMRVRYGVPKLKFTRKGDDAEISAEKPASS